MESCNCDSDSGMESEFGSDTEVESEFSDDNYDNTMLTEEEWLGLSLKPFSAWQG